MPINEFYKSNREGHCPQCDSDNLDYESCRQSRYQDGEEYFPYTCRHCGFQGEEWFSVIFNTHHDTATDEDVPKTEAT